jgi:hypothetical protein
MNDKQENELGLGLLLLQAFQNPNMGNNLYKSKEQFPQKFVGLMKIYFEEIEKKEYKQFHDKISRRNHVN